MQLLQHFKELTVRPKNAQELKGLILQLAIQGKLTSKWREENQDIESVSQLFKEIQKEKEQLIEAKKVKKEKGFAKIKKEEIPYIIPEKWNWYKLAELSSINGGFAFKSSNYIEEGVRVIRISDFDENGFKNHKIVRHEYSDTLDSYVLENKNILIAMTGGTVGKSLFVDEVPEVMVVNQRVATIKIFKPIYEAYINCVIPTRLIQDVIEEAKNSTNDNISMSNIKGFKIPLPPLEEQKEIVKVVETLFKEVEQLEQLTVERINLKEDFVTSALNQLTTNNANLEWTFLQDHFKSFFNETTNIKKLRETVLQLAVQGKLTADWRANNPDTEDASILLKRIQEEKAQLIKDKKIKKEKVLPKITDEEIPYELPDCWVWCRLGNYAHYGALSKIENKNATNATWVLELEDIEKGSSKLLKKIRFIDRDFKSTKSVYKSTDVIYGKLRPYLDKVIVADEDGVCTTEMIPIKSFDKCSPEYLRWFMKNPNFIEYANSSTHGMRMPRMGTDVAKKALISVPPIKEQKAIVQKVNALMGLCDRLEQEVQQSQEHSVQLMQSCLREVFEGKSKVEI